MGGGIGGNIVLRCRIRVHGVLLCALMLTPDMARRLDLGQPRARCAECVFVLLLPESMLAFGA
jgi:hypothetical protein